MRIRTYIWLIRIRDWLCYVSLVVMLLTSVGALLWLMFHVPEVANVVD